jgi:hypothetical protein
MRHEQTQYERVETCDNGALLDSVFADIWDDEEFRKKIKRQRIKDNALTILVGWTIGYGVVSMISDIWILLRG